MARRNSVVSNSTAGKVEKAVAPDMYIDTTTIRPDAQRLSAMSRSSRACGIGRTSMNTMPITSAAAINSARWATFAAKALSLITTEMSFMDWSPDLSRFAGLVAVAAWVLGLRAALWR